MEAWEDDQRLHRAAARSPDDSQGLQGCLVRGLPQLQVTQSVPGEHLPCGRAGGLVAGGQGGRGGGLG